MTASKEQAALGVSLLSIAKQDMKRVMEECRINTDKDEIQMSIGCVQSNVFYLKYTIMCGSAVKVNGKIQYVQNVEKNKTKKNTDFSLLGKLNVLFGVLFVSKEEKNGCICRKYKYDQADSLYL